MKLRGDRHGDPVPMLTPAENARVFADSVESTRRRTYDPQTGDEIVPRPDKAEAEAAWAAEQARPHNGLGDKRDPFADDGHGGWRAV